MAIVMAKAGHDFKSMKSILDEAFDEKFLNSQPSTTKKRGRKFKNSKNTIFTFWTLTQVPGGYRRDKKDTGR